MTTQMGMCRLCVTPCEDHKSLFDENGQCTIIYQLVVKYFDLQLLQLEEGSLLGVLCILCWRHIFDFHNFQLFVYEAQENVNALPKDKPEMIDITKEINEFLPLEWPVANNVQKQQSVEDIFIYDDIEESLPSPQRENIDVISIGDDSDNEITALENFNHDDNFLEEINDIAEILNADEAAQHAELQFENLGTCSEAAKDEQQPTHLTSDSFNESSKFSINTKDDDESSEISINTKDKNTRISLMDADYDAIIAKWKPYLKCRLCSKKFPLFKTLRFHFRQKHPLSKFYVVCCQRRFYYRCKLGEHIRCHMNPYPYKCKVCGKRFTRKSNLISHLHTHQTKTGNKVKGSNSLTKSTKKKKLLVTSPTTRELRNKTRKNSQLDITVLTSEEPNSMKVHNNVNISHDDDDDVVISLWKPSLKCKACGQIYLSFTSLRSHFRKEHPEDTFYIECCRRKFKYRCLLGDHVRRHINPQPFECNFCTKSYRQKGNLITHMQDMHNHRPMNADQKLDDLIVQWKGELECAHCMQTYPSLKLLRHHFRYKHPGKIFHVLCCGQKLMRRWEIEDHLQSHLKICVSVFRCKECNKSFTAQRSLDRHKLTSHKRNKSRKQFEDVVSNHDEIKNIDSAKEQLDNAIAQWKPYLKCMVCSDTLSNYSLLQDHYLREHPKDKCYIKCCRQNLKERSEILHHFQLHCNPETHACMLCDECFISKKDLTVHIQRNHKKLSNDK